MDEIQIAIERLRAEKKNPLWLWLLNLLWPGLGNLFVGQIGWGILFGVLHWGAIAIALLTFGLAKGVLFLNWILASAVGHMSLNKSYASKLAKLQSQAGAAPR